MSTQSSAARGIAELLEALVGAATTELHLRGAVVTVTSAHDSEGIVASSDPGSRALAEVEFSIGEGPAHDAFAYGRPVLVPDLDGYQGDVWPGYAPAALAAGIGAVFAFPLQVGASRFGVFSIFHDVPRLLDEEEVAQCLALSELATELLLDSSAATGDGEIDPDLKSAFGLRSEIYQAQGMVMVTLGVPLSGALALMRAHAFAEGRRLIDVAIDIVEGRLDLTDREGGQ
ncbi:GAF and ANTAR domain-containing protein [Nocardioides sp.]|uniref:GAF and ANTAR domain-containing protein n=1 Tax=Nocardioides sp. TaxID=35761 RepID=UPI00286E95AF|nr:GAF and ANTAR domain-containing protein [Nocardioides sp.]